MFKVLRGVVSLILYALNLLILASLLVISAAVIFLIPIRRARFFLRRVYLQKFPIWFAGINSWIAKLSTRGKWNVLGTGELTQDAWYLMVCNHRSWLDILVLGQIFHQRIPPLKFFMKKELLWQLPLAGLACYVLDYPFMSRHSKDEVKKNPTLKGKDSETTKKACAVLRDFPATFINFLEGTRFSNSKKARQNSPYQHLLKPRAGGVAVVLHELQDLLSGIINVTIAYSGKTPTLWQYACGNFDEIVVRYEVLPITPDLIGNYHDNRHFRTHIQQYFNALWQRNDAVLESLRAKGP